MENVGQVRRLRKRQKQMALCTRDARPDRRLVSRPAHRILSALVTLFFASHTIFFPRGLQAAQAAQAVQTAQAFLIGALISCPKPRGPAYGRGVRRSQNAAEGQAGGRPDRGRRRRRTLVPIAARLTCTDEVLHKSPARLAHSWERDTVDNLRIYIYID